MRFGLYHHPDNEQFACLKWWPNEKKLYMISLVEEDLEDPSKKYNIYVYVLRIEGGYQKVVDSIVIDGENEIELLTKLKSFMGEDVPILIDKAAE